MGTISLIIGLLVILLLIIAILSVILVIIFPEYGYLEVFWITFLRALDPGTLAGDEGTVGYIVVLAIATFVGIFIFSMFVSFILNGFQEKLETLRKGRSRVIEENHTVVLGSTESLKVVLSELILANENQKKEVVVVLSEDDPLELASTIKDYIKDFKTTKIIYRKGSIYNIDDLRMCNVSKAKSIILIEQDILNIKALVALTATNYFERGKGRVSALFWDPENLNVAQKLVGERGYFIYVQSAITKIIAQSCLQAGLSLIYSDLFDFAGDEIYINDGSKLIGKSLVEVQKSFSKSIVIGILRNDKPILNPLPTSTLEEGDQLIVISEDDDTAIVEEIGAPLNLSSILDKPRQSNIEVTNVLFIGYNPKVIAIIKEFDHYVEQGSTITVMTNYERGIIKLNALNKTLHNLSVSAIKNSTIDRQAIEEAITYTSGSIVLFQNEETPKADKDSQTLLTLLHLRDIEQHTDKRYDIVTEIFQVENTNIIELAKADDFVISEQLTSRLLTQIAENPYLVDILRILLEKNGVEIYLKPVELYVDACQTVNGYTLVEACAKKNETYLGYKTYSRHGRERLCMNPLKSDEVHLCPGDKLIVLSED
jgi:Trk K+ transport system NAD-binding subunit